MSHVRKLELSGEIPGRGKKVSSNFSWPLGERKEEVEKIIHGFRKNYENVTVRLTHNFID